MISINKVFSPRGDDSSFTAIAQIPELDMSLNFGDPAGPSQALRSGIPRMVAVLNGPVRSSAPPEALPSVSLYRVEVVSHFPSREDNGQFKCTVTKGTLTAEGRPMSSIEASLNEAATLIEELKAF